MNEPLPIEASLSADGPWTAEPEIKGQGRWRQESEGVKQSPAKGSEEESRDLSAWEAERKMRAVMKAAWREYKAAQTGDGSATRYT